MNVHHELIQNKYTVRRIRLPSRPVPHWHQRMELLLVDSGSFAVSIRGTEYVGLPGDVFVIRSGEIHTIASGQPDSMIYISTFHPSLLYQLSSGIAPVREHIPREMLEAAGICEAIHGLFAEMLQEKEQGKKYADIAIQSRILMLCGLLLRHFEMEFCGRAMENDLVFQEVLHYINEHFREPVSLGDIAKQLSYSSSYVSSMFVTCTGLNFKTYLDTVRINEAIRLLLESDQTVASISADCGYENIRTFNNAFRRVTGVSPSQFRKGNTN